MKRRRHIRSGCINCGGPCTVDCIDNFGNAYKGCANCRFLSQEEIEHAIAGKRTTQAKEDR